MSKEVKNSVESVNAVENLEAQLAAMKAQMEKAKADLAAAKAAQKRANGRPIRTCRFEVLPDLAQPETVVNRSDVHYCAEKFAIDAVKEGKFPELHVVKVGKENNVFLPVAKIFVDENGCLIID